MGIFSSFWQRRGGRHNSASSVVVVSGLPRSGTSLMMRMLEAGGLGVLSDNQRQADIDNLTGYYELERVKQLDKGDQAWVSDARGKAVKVISALLKHLPAEHEYRVLFMERAMPEILASQQKMLAHRGTAREDVSDAEIAALYAKHLAQVKTWLEQQPNFKVMYVSYNQLVTDPAAITSQIAAFLDRPLDTAAMLAAVDPKLYRNRA